MQILNICGGLNGDVFLVVTENKTAVFDTGTPFESKKLIENLKSVLGDRKLDYIFISHTHYDHLGGVAYLKEIYSEAKVFGSVYAKNILEKETALKAIRNMASFENFIPEYKDEVLKVDITLVDGEEFEEEDFKVIAFETMGHTKCSMSFLVNDEVLFVSESIGYMDRLGGVHSAYLVGYELAMASIEKIKQIKCKYVVAPHYGLRSDVSEYFNQCEKDRKSVV